MATVEINEMACIKRIRNANDENLKLASEYMADDLAKAFADNAIEQGSMALGHTAVYDKITNHDDMVHGVVDHNVITVDVTYNQSLLRPMVGTDIPADRENGWKGRWRHTSPSGKHPDDYLQLVNSRHAGDLFHGHYPAWVYGDSFYDKTIQELPSIVGRALRKAGVIYRYYG